MIPLIPALVLAFISLLASAFVILRIVIPILPPSPLSRRVSPTEFGLPSYGSLAPAAKGHLWLAGFDLLALCVFIWQIVVEATSGPSGTAIASDPLSSTRLWFLMTARQACLLVVVAITLLHVRMARSIQFGKTHWMLWAPVILLAVISTALAGVMSGAGLNTLFHGLAVYNGAIAILTTATLAGLFGTLYAIKKNLAVSNEDDGPWPPAKGEESRPSFATEDIDAIRDGESWITSNAGSRRNSVSAWSFSTHHTIVASSVHGHETAKSQTGHKGSVPTKSSFWFSNPSNGELVPPVPPLPSPYGATSETLSGDPDPFRRDLPPLPNHPRGRLDSQTSWLTSSYGSQPTVSAWSFPASQHEGSIRSPSVQDFHSVSSRPATPALATAQVLGGYGYGPGNTSDGALSSLAAPAGAEINVSLRSIIGWFISLWLPLALSLPYLIILAQQGTPSTGVYVLYVLSVTLSSPLLALNVLFKAPLPMPTGLFDREVSSNRLSTALSELEPPKYKWSHEYKRSMSTSPTVVEGRRSGDVWLTNGDAVDGKSKLSRAMSMLSPKPKLSVIPTEELLKDAPPSPPLPITDEDSLPVNIKAHNRSHSENSAQFGRLRKQSNHSSRYSGADESVAHATRIMVAQKHYSTLAQTVVVSPGQTPDKQQAVGNATGVIIQQTTTHLRSRSITTISGPETPSGSSFNDISPPPPFPLPPTPPNVRSARLAQMSHKKSFSSNYSFNAIEDVNEIDALTAGVLPLLVPGLTVGQDMKIKDGDYSPPGTFSKSKGLKAMKKLKEFGEDISSPEIHSTPARRRPRNRKDSHKKNHFSLPSLGLGKEGLQSLANWGSEIRGAFEHKVVNYMAVPSNVDLGYRNTVFGGESIPNDAPHLRAVQEEDEIAGAKLKRGHSKRSLGLRADVPHNVNSARSSMSINVVPPSAASTVTLFEEFEAELQSNPQTHSTPHNTVTGKPSRQPAPPMPKNKSTNKRSSIVYIKSDENTPITTQQSSESNSQSSRSSISQWSSRAVRPLIPKGSKLQRKNTNDSTSSKEGLRQLTLLRDQDTNSLHSKSSHESLGNTRPLTLGKKQKTRRMNVGAPTQDENFIPEDEVAPSGKGIKPLVLARSETSKQRAILRKNEVLPEVVVRPPSMTEHASYAYRFGEA
ncbi:hypothetical protein EST38_g448 [Candolleomyces aberdarensis]|uniref:Uncharacterized protein n=1 Tax=Candolleomyces aberdarensis TaxID=2316362 RepID=A0A4Q2E176_9AGAR|nr:hypothetical protein EST38_g448 [Candolleomyces aberdarensis]